MTRPIVMDIIARDNASKTFKSVADSTTKLAKQTDGLAKNSDNLRKSQLGLVAAQERYNKVASDGKATVGQLASAQKGLITAQQGVRKATADTGAEVGRFGARAKLAFAAAGLAAAGFVKASIDAASSQQKANKQTEAVIKSTGGAANVTAKQVGDLAGSISKLTGIQDDEIQSGENMLLTFTNVRNEVGKGNDIFTQATKVVTDMSVALGQDTKNSAIQLGKALNDPIAGVTALARVGVTFTEDQRKVIARLVETGDTLGAQKVILQELTKEFGGSAVAQATAAGKAKAAWGDFQEAVGNVLLPILDKLLRVTTSVIEWVGKYAPVLVPLGGVIGTFALAVWGVNKATDAWAGATKALTTVLGPRLAGTLGGFVSSLGPPALAIAALTAGVILLGRQLDQDLQKKFNAAKDAAGPFAQALKAAGGAVDANVRKTVAAQIQSLGLDKSLTKNGITLGDLTAAVLGTNEQYDAFAARLVTANVGLGKDAKALHDLHGEYQKQVDALTAVNVATLQSTQSKNLSADAIKKEAQFLAENNLTVEEATKKYNDAVTSAGSFTAQLGYMSNALEAQSGKFITSKLGALALTDAIGTAGDHYAATRAQIDAHGKALTDNTADGRANEEWLLGQIAAINQQAVTYATSSGSIDKGTGSLKTNTDALRVAAEKAGFNKQEVQKMIDTYGATPEQIKTSIEEQGSAAVLASLGDILNQLHAIADPVWGTQFRIANEENNPQLARLPGQARGGLMNGPGTGTSDSILARLSTGEYVVNAAATQKHLGLLENINRNKYAFGGQIGRIPQVPGIAQAAGLPADLFIDTSAIAPAATAWGKASIAAMKKAATPVIPAGVPAPGNISALQAYAFSLFGKYGWGSGALGSLIALWNGESGWNPNAVNPSSGAWGIPQSLPADKMASAGADWRTNGATQIRWGLDYINSVYGSPTNAYSAWLSRSPHWYQQGAWNIGYDQIAGLHRGEMVVPRTSADKIRAGVGGTQVGPINIAVYAAAGMSAEQVARQTAEQIRAVLDDRDRRYAKGARA